MNDWWDYLAHSEVGGERKNHKYYARAVIGTDKHGRVQYRYFYDAREYGAWKTRKQQGKADDVSSQKKKGYTNIITGWGNSTATDGLIARVRSLEPTRLKKGQSSQKEHVMGVSMENSITGPSRKRTVRKTNVRHISVKTIKNKKSLAQRGKDVVAKLLKKK